MDVKRVVGYREFCNKLWNIVKFALSNFPTDFKPKEDGVTSLESKLSLADKWILTRCSKLIDSTNQNLADYKFGDYSNDLYEFWKKNLQMCTLKPSSLLSRVETLKRLLTLCT